LPPCALPAPLGGRSRARWGLEWLRFTERFLRRLRRRFELIIFDSLIRESKSRSGRASAQAVQGGTELRGIGAEIGRKQLRLFLCRVAVADCQDSHQPLEHLQRVLLRDVLQAGLRLNHPWVRDSTGPRALFGKYLRELRLRRGLTQEELAERAHLHRNYVGGVERGERNISLINIVELARALSTKPADLLTKIP